MQHAAQHQQAGLSSPTPSIADIAAIAAAATAMLTQSSHPPALLIEACCQLATHYFDLDAAQEALSMLGDQPPLQPAAQQRTRTPTKQQAAAKQAASSAAGVASPFAAMACAPRQASGDQDSSAISNSACEGSDAAKVWTEAHLAKLAPLKIQPAALTSALLPLHTPKAAAQPWTTSPGSSARSTASPLQPGLLDQYYNNGSGVAAWASGSQTASPQLEAQGHQRLHHFYDDESVVSILQ
jgi:hypothetical protein